MYCGEVECDSTRGMVQAFPSTTLLVRLAGAVMCEQDEIWQEFRCFSEAKMGELYEKARTRGIDGTVDWARADSLRIWRYTNFLDNPY